MIKIFYIKNPFPLFSNLNSESAIEQIMFYSSTAAGDYESEFQTPLLSELYAKQHADEYIKNTLMYLLSEKFNIKNIKFDLTELKLKVTHSDYVFDMYVTGRFYGYIKCLMDDKELKMKKLKYGDDPVVGLITKDRKSSYIDHEETTNIFVDL